MVAPHDDEPRESEDDLEQDDSGQDDPVQADEARDDVEHGEAAAPPESGAGFPVAGEPLPEDRFGEPTDQRRELTALEMMDAPPRPDERTRKAVLWMALSFATVMFVLTIGVIVSSGLDILEVFVVLMLAGLIYGLVGALRYKGEDPMAQFDPPPIPKKRIGRRDRGEDR